MGFHNTTPPFVWRNLIPQACEAKGKAKRGLKLLGEDNVGGIPYFGRNRAASLGRDDDLEGGWLGGEVAQKLLFRVVMQRLNGGEVAKDGENIFRGRGDGSGVSDAAELQDGVAFVEGPGHS